MFTLWLHEFGSRIIALPFRIIIGLVFINQGVQNMRLAGFSPGDTVGHANGATNAANVASAADNARLLLDLKDFGLQDFGTYGIGALLVLAGVMAIVGFLVRIVGGVLAFVVFSNLFAGFTVKDVMTDLSGIVQLLQNRLLLGISALVLFFLGAGMFAMDHLIFRGVGYALGMNDDSEKKGKGKSKDDEEYRGRRS